MVTYHDSDFSFEEWSIIAHRELKLPEISCAVVLVDDNEQKWENFFRSHRHGIAYKPRRYLYEEFRAYLTSDNVNAMTICEVGCGHGSSIFPLMRLLPSARFIATDFSQEALEIMSRHREFDPDIISSHRWDISRPAPSGVVDNASHILCIFVLSSIDHCRHEQCLRNIREVLQTDGVVLFRDYAIHDMTMYRHEQRLDECLFRRQDGTLAYYFSKEYFHDLAERSCFEVVECHYSTVVVRNRSLEKNMKRVFLHAVLKKSSHS